MSLCKLQFNWGALSTWTSCHLLHRTMRHVLPPIVSELELVLHKVTTFSRYDLVVHILWYSRHQLLSLISDEELSLIQYLPPATTLWQLYLVVVSLALSWSVSEEGLFPEMVRPTHSWYDFQVSRIPYQTPKPRTYIEVKFFSRNMVFFKRIPFSKSTFMVFPSVLCGSRGRVKS